MKAPHLETKGRHAKSFEHEAWLSLAWPGWKTMKKRKSVRRTTKELHPNWQCDHENKYIRRATHTKKQNENVNPHVERFTELHSMGKPRNEIEIRTSSDSRSCFPTVWGNTGLVGAFAVRVGRPGMFLRIRF